MAIYGSLSDLPAPEILNMLARRTGHLKVTTEPQPGRAARYDLHLDRDHLMGLFLDSRELTDTMLVRDAFRKLLEIEIGTFEFESVEPDLLNRSLRLPIKQLILSTATIIDELENYRSRFPHPDIVFHVTGPIHEHLPGDLELFWIRAEEHLQRGISANALSEALNLSVEEVQLHFYKLRSVGRLVPRRSYAQARPQHRPSVLLERERPHLLRRLLGSLARIGRNSR